MKFEMEWIDDVPNRMPEERATVCDMKIWLDKTNISEHVDVQTKERYEWNTIAAYGLAEAITELWRDILSGKPVRLKDYSFGYAIPDITLQRYGNLMVITARPYTKENPGVTFVQYASEQLNVFVFMEQLSVFIRTVIQRLQDKGVKNTDLEWRWAN